MRKQIVRILIALAVITGSWAMATKAQPKVVSDGDVFGRTLCAVAPWLCKETDTPVHPRVAPEKTWDGRVAVIRRSDPAYLHM